jgi:diamine N-acetyltransferase
MASPVVELRPITRDNLAAVIALDAGDGGVQVAPNVRSMAQAAVYGEAWPRAIYAGGEPVGFVMLYDPSLVEAPEEPHYFLWRLMIDRAQQRRGLGAAAVRALIDHVRMRPGARELRVSYVEGQHALRRFYEGLGFVATGEVDDGEIVMAVAL